MQDTQGAAEILKLFPSTTEEPTSAPTIETFDELIGKYEADVDEISAQFGISREEVIDGIRYRYEKAKAFFPNISWAINVYRYNLQFDAAAEKVLERYRGYKISRELATKIAQCEDADRQCAECNGVICTKVTQFRRHSVNIVGGEVTLNPNDVCSYEKERRLRRKIDRAQIPPRYAGLTFDDYTTDASNQNAVKWARYILKNPQQSLFITGGAGTGKTFLAAIVAQELIKKGKSVVFVNVPVLLREIQETWKLKTDAKGDKVTEMMILKTLYSCDVLILDDLGAENQSAWSVNTLYGIINERYGKELPTIITSNFSLEEMEEVLTTDKTGSPIKASQIIDRLYDSDLFRNIEFFGKSRRRKRNQ